MRRRKPVEEMSKDPRAIRARIRGRATPLAEDIEALAAVQRKPLAEWDLEELARGRPRDKNGGFQGMPPKWITPALRSEAARRLKLEAHAYLSGHVSDAIKVLVGLMTDEDQEPRLRADAAKFIIEHVVGKARQSVDLEAGEGLKGMLAGALKVRRITDGKEVDAHPVIDLNSEEWTDVDDG